MESADLSPDVAEDRVDDDEVLYHAVRELEFRRLTETSIWVSENAYSTPNMKPSVDRAKLRAFEPQHSRFRPSDAVVSLVAEGVRGLKNIYQFDKRGNPIGPLTSST